MDIPVNSTGVPLPIYCRALTGAALLGKTAGDFLLWYTRDDGTSVSVSAAGIAEIGAGEYRLTFPDAAFAEGSLSVAINGTVDGGVVLGYPIGLTDTGGGSGSVVGPGADAVTLDFELPGDVPIADADVWITSDAAGMTVIAGTLQTNSEGRVTFRLDDGCTYYAWLQKDGVNSIQGQAFVAERDS